MNASTQQYEIHPNWLVQNMGPPDVDAGHEAATSGKKCP